jgi:uncharacterized protein (TIGR02246 family)
MLSLGSMAWADDASVEAAIRKQADATVAAFDRADAAGLADLFLAEGEMINEAGTVYRGRDELKSLFADFFGRFPGAKLTLQIESIRAIGPMIAVEDGARSITTTDGQSRANLRYTTVWSKVNDQWKMASVREVADESPATPHQMLESLAWLIGDWVNEGDDAAVKISYRWSEDGNYLLADYEILASGRRTSQSTQRIGWDPAHQRIRSWLFDTDGGFAEGTWTPIPDGWVIHSSAVLPSGESASALVSILPQSDSQFTLKGTNRLIGGTLDDDFEVVVIKRPPSPSTGNGTEKKGETNASK